MNQPESRYPSITKVEELADAVNLTLSVSGDLFFFKGHFPTQPILPGVVQLEWAVHYACKYLQLSSEDVKRVEVLKFQVVIPAEITLTLAIAKKSAEKFSFTYRSSLGTHASGRVVMHD